MEQLSVEIGSGRVFLRNVLLDCNVLNEDLVGPSCYAFVPVFRVQLHFSTFPLHFGLLSFLGTSQ